ncbi:MAG: hypothetical protein NVSMB17_00150 [Candidatus Dormibacteria bacterium]
MLNLAPYRNLLRARPLAFGVAGGIASAVAIATTTALYANPVFRRMTPVRAQDWVFLAATSGLMAVLSATYAVPAAPTTCEKRMAGGGFLNVLAIGCPICNKVVVALLGISGALTYWAPIQPIVAIGGLALLVWALRVRLGLLSSSASTATPGSAIPG